MTLRRLVVVAALVLAAGACGHDGPPAGYVRNRDFTPAHDEWVAGIYVPGSCSMVGKVEECSPPVSIPGHYEHHDDSWSLYLDNGHKKGWTDVSEAVYNRCARIGQWCDTRSTR